MLAKRKRSVLDVPPFSRGRNRGDSSCSFFCVFRIPISSRLLRARKNVTGSSAFSAIRVKQGSSSYGVWQSMEKSLVIFQPGKVWKEVFYGLLE